MPRRHRHRRRTMKGGFFDALSSWGSSISQGASNIWDKTKNAASSATSGLTGTPSSTYSPAPSYPSAPTTPYQPMTTSTYGGRTRRRRMRGGFKDNTPTTGLAAHAASFSGITAPPHNLVGGKTRKRRGRKSHRRH